MAGVFLKVSRNYTTKREGEQEEGIKKKPESKQTLRASFLARSNPSVITRGWAPSVVNLLACFMSSPIIRTDSHPREK